LSDSTPQVKTIPIGKRPVEPDVALLALQAKGFCKGS